MSDLRKALNEYLAVRRALGFKLKAQGRLLHNFVDFANRQGASFITRSLALRWAMESPAGQPAYWASRLGLVRGFAEYRSCVDPRTEIPPPGLLPHRYRRKSPYVYSDDDIQKLITAAQQLRSPKGLRATTFSTLFGLLAVAGLRISECLTLDRQDVDLVEGTLQVRQAKFGKSRWVPLHPSTCGRLKHYATLRDRAFPRPKDTTFLVSERGTRLSGSYVHATFLKLSRRIGLRSPRAQHGPRIHDLRHGFAIRTLTRLYRAGADVERHLPVLAAYLGHVDVVSTYWYLTATPELLRLACGRLDRKKKEVAR
ncbi:MAG: tyrosine-type recombinase/integrase [Terriglobia bacterium]